MQLNFPMYLFCRAGIVLFVLWFWQNQFCYNSPSHLHSLLCWPVSSSAESVIAMLPLQFCQPVWLPSIASEILAPLSFSTFFIIHQADLGTDEVQQQRTCSGDCCVHFARIGGNGKLGHYVFQKKEKKRLKLPFSKSPEAQELLYSVLLLPLCENYTSPTSSATYSPFTSWKTKM